MSDCGSEGRGFESHLPPQTEKAAPQGRPCFLAAIKARFELRTKNKDEPGDSRVQPFLSGDTSRGSPLKHSENGNPCFILPGAAFSVW
jgi:hypothetical protein